jgi:hypothetical protein
MHQDQIYLFATRLNTQLSTYSSWKPDPGCKCIDAFTVSWSSLLSYIFAPFSLLGRVVQKLRRDRAESTVNKGRQLSIQSCYK